MDAAHAVVVDAKRVALAGNANAEGFHIRDPDAFHFGRERANRGENPSQSYGRSAEEIPSSNQSASGNCSKVYNERCFCIHLPIGIKWRAFRMKAALMDCKGMNRRSLLKFGGLSAAGLISLPALPFAAEKSDLKITGVRLVKTRPKHPAPAYKPAAGSWSTQGVEVANPMSIYPRYKPTRSLWFPDPGKLGGFTVEISTDKGVKGYGNGGTGGGEVVTEHFTKLLMGENPFDIERLWDTMWRSSMPYGRDGIAINAISGVDLALWDLVGNALQMPVYKLLGGETKERIPAYCTGNDVEQHLNFGYKRVKLATPYGPADG